MNRSKTFKLTNNESPSKVPRETLRNSVLLPRDPQGKAEGNIEVAGKQNSLLPAGAVIEFCSVYFPNKE